jgi:predicted permease
MLNIIINKLFPVILMFVLGYSLKKKKVFKSSDAQLFLKLAFYVSIPALLIQSISKINISNFYYLPLIAVLIYIILFFISHTLSNILKLKPKTKGTFIIGSLIMNGSFVIPFYISMYGIEEMGRFAIYDLGNALMIYSFVYVMACRYGSDEDAKINIKEILKKLFFAPPFLGILIGLIFNISGTELPEIINNFLSPLGILTGPLFMIALGMNFNPRLINGKYILCVIGIRVFLGLAISYMFVNLFNIEGMNKIAVLLLSSAPTGATTLTYSALEDLDIEFASSLVSYSILFGLFFIPTLIYFIS